jgi:transcriptional regulator with XRE-family HTH domain
MGWEGSRIKDLAKANKISMVKLSKAVGVSRQALNAWIGGQVPRGQHLVKLCSELGIDPGSLFQSPNDTLITAPRHRTVGKRKVTDEMAAESLGMATQYINLFRAAPSSDIVSVVRVKQRKEAEAIDIAKRLRQLSDIDSDKPMSFEHIFIMIDKLGIYTVFSPFPDSVNKKIYAFYSKIAGQRVIFINTDTNIIDLKFQLLHETVHALRDEAPDFIYDDTEENFCDLIAGYVQFPDEYVRLVAKAIDKCPDGVTVNKLKDFAKINRHSMFGIVKRLAHLGINIDSKVAAAADANLRKSIPKVSGIIFGDGDPRSYVARLNKFSPRFVMLVAEQKKTASIRKIGEWLGLSSAIDAQAVVEELGRIEHEE